MDPEDLVIPVRIYMRLKYYTWTYVITPLNPYIRDVLLFLGLIWHEKGQQKYPLGKLAKGKNFKDLKQHLLENHGFEEGFPAWVDEGEVFGVRYRENIYRQYHIRAYDDGMVCGHYEYTPECYPLHHIREIDMEPRRYKFDEFLEGWLDDKGKHPINEAALELVNLAEK